MAARSADCDPTRCHLPRPSDAVTGQAQQAAHTLGTYAVRFALGALMGAVINRALGPEGRGAYAVLVTIATTALHLGHLSIEESHVSLWFRARDSDAITTNSLLFGMALGGLCSVAGGMVVVCLGPEVLPVPSYGFLAVALATIPFAMTEKLLARVMVLRARIEINNWSGLLSVGVQCGALIVLAATGTLTLWWVITLWAACAAAPLALLLPAARPRLRRCDIRLAYRTLCLGLRYHIGLVSVFLLLRVDILILNAMTTTVAVGMYAVAVTFVELSRVPPDAVANIATPGQLESDEESAAAFTVKATRLAALVAAVSTGLTCVAAPILIPAVYGWAFAGSVGPLLGLAPGLWVIGASRPVGTFLLRLDRPLLNSATAVAALAVNVGLNLTLIPSFGIVGSAFASSIGYATLAALQVAWFLRATRTPLQHLIPRRSDALYLWGTACQMAFSRVR
jgi:O-antigen/teichoic acid export membrane protein